jgi:hypothetical protein
MAKKRDEQARLHLEFIIGILGILIIFGISAAAIAVDKNSEALARSVGGGGSIEQTSQILSGDKISELTVAYIAFSGNVGLRRDGIPSGSWQVRFRDSGNSAVANGQFHSTSITSIIFTEDSCEATVQPGVAVANFVAEGKFNGEPGWSMDTSIGVSSGSASVGIILYNPAGEAVYRTALSQGGDFSDDAGFEACPETLRTALDGGNLQVR